MSKSKDGGISAGDILLVGGIGVGALLLLRSMSQPKPLVAPVPASSGGGILSSIFGALTGAGSSVAGAAQSTASQSSPLDPSQIPAGAAASVGGAVSNFFGSILGPSPASSPSQVSGLGSLGGTVFDHPTLPISRGRVIPPGMTGRVPGRGAMQYGAPAAPMTMSRGRMLPPGMTGRVPGRGAVRYR